MNRNKWIYDCLRLLGEIKKQSIVVLSDIYATSNPNYFAWGGFLMRVRYDRVRIHRLRNGRGLPQKRPMKRSKRAAPTLARVNKRAEALIEALLKEMQRGVSDQAVMERPEWERLFGAKQSLVVNLQKLVQALAALPLEMEPSKETANPEGQRLSDEEMRLLTAWLEEGKN